MLLIKKTMEGTIRQGARITALAFIGPEGGATELTDMPFDMVARIYEDIEDDDIGNMNSALTGTTYSDAGDKFLPKACNRYLQKTLEIKDICENPKNLTQLKCKEQLRMCDRALYSFDQLIDEGQGVYRIPHGVEVVVEVKDDRFQDIYEIIVPNTVTTIGFRAFNNCQRLESINLPNSITEIQTSAFRLCKRLASVHIPNSVTKIGMGAFHNCERLATINIPNSVTEIGMGAFSFCKRLTAINIPNSVTEIAWGAFLNCERLTSIIIPDSVTKIGEHAFNYCRSLEDITLPRHFRNKSEMVQKAFEANVIDKIKYL